MPQLKIRGVSLEKVLKFSEPLVDELQFLLECPREYLTIEHINSVFINDGKIYDGYPFAEIAWFDRGQEIRDRVAKIVSKYFYLAGYKNVDVYFIPLDKNSYYENGDHF